MEESVTLKPERSKHVQRLMKNLEKQNKEKAKLDLDSLYRIAFPVKRDPK
jgi:hypothetical protein